MICNYYIIFHIIHPNTLVTDLFSLYCVTNTMQQNPGHRILVYKTEVSSNIITTITLNQIAYLCCMICNYHIIFHTSHSLVWELIHVHSITLQIITNKMQQNPGHNILVGKTAVVYFIMTYIVS